MTNGNGSGLAQKMLFTLSGFVFIALMAFFGWLATTVIDIRERVVSIEAAAKALTTARDREIQLRSSSNAERLDRLEEAAE